jgi:hypothetical protein
LLQIGLLIREEDPQHAAILIDDLDDVLILLLHLLAHAPVADEHLDRFDPPVRGLADHVRGELNPGDLRLRRRRQG